MASKTKNTEKVLAKILKQELSMVEGNQTQNPETGAGVGSGKTYVSEYTNNIFGAPFQLIDSVDRRFTEVNTHVGNEYLRNFILNSPILHIKPGMPRYTGGADGNAIMTSIKEAYIGKNSANMSTVESLLESLAQNTIFGVGSKLQKRMFSFRETYWQYMSYVNYMCRSMATFLNLTSSAKYPRGVYIGGHLHGFANLDWQNYRMLTSSKAYKPWTQLKKMGKATLLGAAGSSVATAVKDIKDLVGKSAQAVSEAFVSGVLEGTEGAFDEMIETIAGAAMETGEDIADTTAENFEYASETSVADVMVDKVCSVLFMVEPVQFEENLSNTAEDSVAESAVDTLTNSVGHEIAFITGSHVDAGMIEGTLEFLGNDIQSAMNYLTGLVDSFAGGWIANLFSGAIGSVKGQKMIYPKIYKGSNSETNYTFTVNLSSPYGDVYNYYVNIVVPLMHLIALAAPRMITSNSVASPFLVQAFIPGMCTCHMGIISNMQIIKNPSMKHVSVDGFPLDIKVQFTIQELYNALSISPANDPASFLFNETLNDYMANLAGLQPSVNTYTNQRISAFGNLANYFNNGEYAQDVAQQAVEKWEDSINPFAFR